MSNKNVEVDYYLLKELFLAAKTHRLLTTEKLSQVEVLLSQTQIPNKDALLDHLVMPVLNKNNLRAGTTAYGYAVVISLDPFIVASQDGKCRWEEQLAKDFISLGPAAAEICERLKNIHLIKKE